MSNRELYQQTFDQVHSQTELRWEDFEKKARQRGKRARPHRRLLALAAALAVLAALSAAAVATNLLGLRELLLPKQQVQEMDENGVAVPGQTHTVDAISLSGYADSPESQALAQWQAFLAGYDPDGAILSVVGNQLDESLSRYLCYNVYTQAMADELEAIAAQYGLTLHTQLVVVDGDEWEQRVGGDFLGPSQAYAGTGYENGTFLLSGSLAVEGYGTLEYQFIRSVKGCLDEALLTVGSLEDYQEWQYTAQGGQAVTLALGPDKGLLLTQLPDSFITVNVLMGSEQGVTGQTLEALADSFDYAALTPARPLAEPLPPA